MPTMTRSRPARPLPSPRAILPGLIAAACLVAAPARADGGRVVPVRDIRVYLEEQGSGPPLLLLHGGAGNGMQFAKQREAFARRHRLLIPDCRGQGRTTLGTGPFDYHAMAEDMLALLDSLHVAKVDVMGWSDGGDIGLDLAIHHPGRIVHLVTFGANASPEGLRPADRAWAATATADSFGDGMRRDWSALNPEPDRYREAMEKILAMWRTEPRFTARELAAIRARVLVCAGEHDLILPEHTALLTREIPGARSWIVPGASHGAMLERPDLVNPRVLAFLDEGPHP
jgi:pimeloyl-ACP methyl ester carboxylesterase